VFVSTVSAYRQWPHEPVNESSPVWSADADADPGVRGWDPEVYGPLKVGCELAEARVFGPGRLLVFRPHVVLGPHEYVGRLAWWLSRAVRGGPVLVPGPDRDVQPVDVRDLATFVCGQIAVGSRGVLNVAAPRGRDTFGGLVRACGTAVASQARAGTELVWVDEDWLVEQGVVQWTQIPLWRNAAAPWEMDTSRAQAAGLTCRPLAVTVADTWAWLRAGGRAVPHERFAEHGLAGERETELLAQWGLYCARGGAGRE
jgi:nucleoside-diphosphate-sugar epimerase